MAFIPHPNNSGSSRNGNDGAGPGAGPGGGPDQKGQEEEGTAQSFLRKYWYVILPLVIANFMGTPAAPEQPAQAAGGEEGATGQPAAASVAAAPSGLQSKQRRGKRT
jgi:hypothetical protein